MNALRLLPLRIALAVSAALFAITATPAAAEEEGEVPYWVSLTTDKANMRVGPGGSYRIEWVYQRRGLPLKVVRKLSGWRLVEDPDGARGWVVSRFLSRERAAIVIGDGNAAMRAQGDAGADLLWELEPGVTGWLGDCDNGWCRFEIGHDDADRRAGFIEEARLWGTGEP